MHLEGAVLEDVAAGDAADPQEHLAYLDLRLRIQVADLAADHQAHQLVLVQFLDRQGVHDASVAHDRYPVGDAEDLVQLVRDVQDRYALRGEVPYDPEEVLDLLLRERGRRLVHDDHLRVYGERLGDLYPLHLGDRQAGDEPVGVGAQAHTLQQTPGLLGLGPPVDEPEAARLAAHVEVLCYREVGGQGELLVDHRHPQGLRVARAVELDGLAGDLDLTPARPLDLREELHQGGLAGPVLPGHDVDLARHDVKVHAVHREDPWELLGDAAEPDYRLSCIGRRHLLLLLASPSISRGWPAASSAARSSTPGGAPRPPPSRSARQVWHGSRPRATTQSPDDAGTLPLTPRPVMGTFPRETDYRRGGERLAGAVGGRADVRSPVRAPRGVRGAGGRGRGGGRCGLAPRG